MGIGIVTATYIAASVLFILALGGLSNQEKAKRAVWYGIVGINLLLDKKITKTGVMPPELVGSLDSCWDYIFNYLANRKVHIKRI